MRWSIALVSIVLVWLFVATAGHAEANFQFAAPGLRAPDDPRVNGVRVTAFYGENRRVRGLDLGLFAVSETTELTGFASIFGIYRVRGDVVGAATAIVNLHEGTDRGLNLAFLNQIKRHESGANVGVVNLGDRASTTDIGMLNVGGRSGIQVGAVNISDRLEGIQFGFLNIAENGFLPVFPFFNFPVD